MEEVQTEKTYQESKIKQGWPTWLRGGIVGCVLYLLLSTVYRVMSSLIGNIAPLLLSKLPPLSPFFLILYFWKSFSVPYDYLMVFSILMQIINFFTWFIVGALISLIFKRIKPEKDASALTAPKFIFIEYIKQKKLQVIGFIAISYWIIGLSMLISWRFQSPVNLYYYISIALILSTLSLARWYDKKRISQISTKMVRKCDQCGIEYRNDGSFCPSCGRKTYNLLSPKYGEFIKIGIKSAMIYYCITLLILLIFFKGNWSSLYFLYVFLIFGLPIGISSMVGLRILYSKYPKLIFIVSPLVSVIFFICLPLFLPSSWKRGEGAGLLVIFLSIIIVANLTASIMSSIIIYYKFKDRIS